MSNFTPPVRASQTIQQFEVDDEPLVKRCMAHFSPNHYGFGVWILRTPPANAIGSPPPLGTVQEYMPVALYDSKARPVAYPEERILYFFQGNATYTNIPADAATYLTAAGYTLS